MNLVLRKVRDRLYQHDEVIRNLQYGQDRRRRKLNIENEYENEDDDEDKVSEVGIDRISSLRGGTRGIRPWWNLMGWDEIDRNLGSIKMKRLFFFYSKNDSGVYLEWEKKIKLIFFS